MFFFFFGGGGAFWGFTVSGARVLYFLRVRLLSLRVQGVSEFKTDVSGLRAWELERASFGARGICWVSGPLGVMSPKVLGLRDVSMINRGFLKLRFRV